MFELIIDILTEHDDRGYSKNGRRMGYLDSSNHPKRYYENKDERSYRDRGGYRVSILCYCIYNKIAVSDKILKNIFINYILGLYNNIIRIYFKL